MRKNSTNVVRETREYDKFRFLGANREQSRGHVEALKLAFEEVGNMTRVQPILVNEKFEIIDGQHRFTACKELELPIYYTQVDGLGVDEARSMNILHRNWRADDYARSYANSGVRSYQLYLQLKEEYEFNHSVLLEAIFNNGTKGKFKEFREGQLVIDDEQKLRERLDKLDAMREHTPLANTREFAVAALRVFGAPGYDHRRMLKKVKQYSGQLKRYNTLEDNLRQLEDLYNYRHTEGTRLRLY